MDTRHRRTRVATVLAALVVTVGLASASGCADGGSGTKGTDGKPAAGEHPAGSAAPNVQPAHRDLRKPPLAPQRLPWQRG
jgi:hypothetical protein